MKKIKKLKSSVPSTKSTARRMFEDGLKRMQSLSARNVKAKPLTNSAKFADKHPPMPNRTVRVLPLAPQGTLAMQLPETEQTRKGVSLSRLLANTPKLIRWNAEDVVVKKLAKKKTKSGLPAIVSKAVTMDKYRKKEVDRTYDLYIIGIDSQTTPVSKQRRVLVSCSCPHFVFTCEYANAAHGASKIIYSNGQPPGFKNPGEVPNLCKHLVALTREVKEKGM